ncbi:MerR family transcriptional regulator [Corynebacterium pacaense]|uniref:MerR family transcriptional regulator n=1 Tax=Corynebacterium pacaense TaxID=1816684 RepID=UPI0011784DAA|nr:MerR family transcriptional regulator [Corynebacterium pacaense]
MSDRSIGEAAELLGVSTRALRHWDSIGLLQPEWRTASDYRLYTDADMEKAMQILVYRAAGVPLREIAELLTAPDSVKEHLLRQRRLLEVQITHLRRKIRAVDRILKENTMTIEDKAELFGRDWPDYQEEAEQRWGQTPEWEQSRRVRAEMSPQDVREAQEELESFAQSLVDASTAGIRPGSAEGDALALRHRASISRWYETTPSKQVLLARMYIGDPRFDAAYRGHSAYLLSLVEALAESEGVDLKAVKWC